MPGKAKRPNSIPLTRKESNIASSILVKYFNPELGESQMRDKSDEIVNEINKKFIKNGLEPKYLTVKMTDWISNRLYRLRKCNSNEKQTHIIKKKTPVIKKKLQVIKKQTVVIKKESQHIKRKTPVIKKVSRDIKNQIPVIKKKRRVIKNKIKNLEKNDIYNIDLEFIDLLPPIMDCKENYEFLLNKVKDDYVSIIDSEMFDCLPDLEY